VTEPKKKMRLTLMPDGSTKLVPADKTHETMPEKLDATPKEKTSTKASPIVRKIAADRGADLSTITPTGPDGTITVDDVVRSAPLKIESYQVSGSIVNHKNRTNA